MDVSSNSARILRNINYIQIVPLSLGALSGFFTIFPIVLWVIGLRLFMFYYRHAAYTEHDFEAVERWWLISAGFNAVGLLMPIGLITNFISYRRLLASEKVIRSFDCRFFCDDDAALLVPTMAVLSLFIVIHFILSIRGYRHWMGAHEREKSMVLRLIGKLDQIAAKKGI